MVVVTHTVHERCISVSGSGGFGWRSKVGAMARRFWLNKGTQKSHGPWHHWRRNFTDQTKRDGANKKIPRKLIRSVAKVFAHILEVSCWRTHINCDGWNRWRRTVSNLSFLGGKMFLLSREMKFTSATSSGAFISSHGLCCLDSMSSIRWRR